MEGDVSSGTMLAFYDSAPLNKRFWLAFSIISLVFVLEFFDLYIVGFLVAVLGPQWKLTYGQSALMLLSAGVGSIVGSFFCGHLSDAWGRKAMIVFGTLACAAGSGLIAITPDGNWEMFVAMRFLIGLGLGAAVAPAITLAVELTPTRHRTVMPGLMIVFATVGVLVASGTAAWLLALLGWRGIAFLGIAPLIPGVLTWLVAPESVRWLISQRRTEEARAVIARQLALPLDAVPAIAEPVPKPEKPTLRELYSDPARFWFSVVVGLCLSTAGYGVYLWGPTIVAMKLNMSVKDAGQIFFFVALSGVTGKVIMSILPHYIGRRRVGEICGYGIMITLALAGWFNASVYGTIPLFIVFLCIGALFFDGGHSSCSPYAAEIFPVRQAAGGVGLYQAANSVGKILGPLSLAVIAGTDNLVAPKATAEAVFPAFLFLAFCGLCMGVAFTLYRVETRGKSLAMGDPASPKADIRAQQVQPT
jgi:MFS transporter, putative metabolite:H+ symporter